MHGVTSVKTLFVATFNSLVGRDSVVGIATRYGLEVRGMNPEGARFSAPVQTGPGAHLASYMMGTGCFPGVKRPGRGVDHPPRSSAEVKESKVIRLLPPPPFLWGFGAVSRGNL